MRIISAAIVVLAGAIIFASSGHILHSDTQHFYGLVGFLLTAFGLFTWFSLLRYDKRSD